MADRTVRVRVIAELPGFAAAMRMAGADTTRLGEAAALAGRGVRTLGLDATAARGGLTVLTSGARGSAVAISEAEAAALAAGRGLVLVRDEAAAAGPAFARMGSAASAGMGSVRSGAESALSSLKHLGLLLAGGAIFYGLHDIVHMGNEYTDAMNKFLEVTRASGGQMEAAGREAQALGADMKLPSASAAEAADAMVELAKAGLSAQDAIKAARGTIQLAAAARTDVATAAKIEGDIMDQFALKSSEATKVADVLANTSNSASGELMDLYYAMKYVGPIAHTMGISIQETAAAVGLLGKSGIIGETAGTALRAALVNMSKPSKQVKEGLHELGIEAFDSQGNFKGLEYVIESLGKAQEHMSTQQFTAAAAMAFGKPALAAMVALAHQGGPAFEQMSVQVGRVGGAAALAAAESKGLGGAMRGLGKQISSAFLQVYLGVAPTLEKITRGMTTAVSSAIPYIKNGIRIAGDLWDIYGPTVEKKLDSAASGIGKSAESMLVPLKAGLTSFAVATVPLAITSVGALGKIFDNARTAVGPLVGGLHDMVTSVSGGAGAVGVLTGRLQVGVSMLGNASGVLRPLAQLVGDLAHAFSGLPGPIQLSVLGMLAMRPFRPQIQSMQTAVTDFGRAGITAFRGIGDASLYQRVQAANAGITLGRFGGIMAELEHRSPVIAAMGTSFRNTSASIAEAGGRMSGFRSVAGGLAMALGTGARAGLMGAMRGLWSFLGGPWGVAIGAAMIGLDLLAKRQQQAAAAAAAHQARISSLTTALQQSNGVIDGSVRAAVVQTLADTKLKDGKTQLLDVMHKAHVDALQLTNAYMGQGDSVDALRKRLHAVVEANRVWVQSGRFGTLQLNEQGKAALAAYDALGSMDGELPAAISKQKELAAAIKGGGGAAKEATDPTSRLKSAIATLGSAESDADTKARALHTALNLLSGGELDVEAATANMNAALLDVNSLWKNGVDESQGYKDALLQVDGSLNTTTQNGQSLWTKLQALNEQTAAASQATYDYARVNGATVPQALKQAEAGMQKAWEAAVTAAEKFGLTADQAKTLANQMGFIPSNLAITMAVKDLDPTVQALLYVQGLAAHMPQGSTIKVSALTEEATKALTDIGFQIRTLPGGRQMEITAPTDKAQAALDALIAKKLPDKTLQVDASTRSAMDDLQAVKDKIASVPPGKSVIIRAPSDSAIQALREIGYKVETLPDHTVRITVPTGGSISAVDALQNRIDNLHGKYIVLTTENRTIYTGQGGRGPNAYADGGMVRHAAQGLFVPGFAPRHDIVPAVLSPGEGVLVPETVRKLAHAAGLAPEALIKRLNAWGRYGTAMGYANGGLVGVRRFASGGVVPQYTASSAPQLYTVADVKTRMDDLVKQLNEAWNKLGKGMDEARKKTQSLHDAEANLRRVRSHHHTVAQLAAAEKQLRDARQAAAAANAAVNSQRGAVNSLDAQLGLAKGAAVPNTWSLTAYSKMLADSLQGTEAWRAGLDKIATRGGKEVRDIIEQMGQDGYGLVLALSKASDAQFKDITDKLLRTAGVAKASLADFQKQVDASNQASAQFAQDLQTLAAKGYGALAQALAGQGDAAAQALAHQAATGNAAAAAANASVTAAGQVLSGQDLTDALVLLSTLRGGTGRGYSELIAAGLSTATIRALVPRILSQIDSLPAANKAAFLTQWAGQTGQGVTAMAEGGILTGRSPIVVAGERGAEAYIPLNASARSRMLLAHTAAALGYQLVPAGRFAHGSGGGSAGTTHVDQSRTIHLHGSHQSLAEQRADLMRHMVALG